MISFLFIYIPNNLEIILVGNVRINSILFYFPKGYVITSTSLKSHFFNLCFEMSFFSHIKLSYVFESVSKRSSLSAPVNIILF